MWCGRVASGMFLRGVGLCDVAPCTAQAEKGEDAEDKVSGARLVSGCSGAQHVTDYEHKEGGDRNR